MLNYFYGEASIKQYYPVKNKNLFKNLKTAWFLSLDMQYTVKPLLSGHPLEIAIWPLNRGNRLIEVFWNFQFKI